MSCPESLSDTEPLAEHVRAVDLRSLFLHAQLPCVAKAIVEHPGMYPHKERVEDNWTYYSACAFQKIAQPLDLPAVKFPIVKTAGLIGVGSGVEALTLIAATQGTLRDLVITDLRRDLVEVARLNLISASTERQINLLSLNGEFCEPLLASGLTFDLIYANLPNLETGKPIPADCGAETGTFIPRSTLLPHEVPKRFSSWALSSQYVYLRQARRVVRKNGVVLTAIGGRVPLEIIEDLFRTVGFICSEVLLGFKLQTEALIDLVGYSECELANSVRFSFYAIDQVTEILLKRGLQLPIFNISARELRGILAPLELSATEALSQFQRGAAIGHIVHILAGNNPGE
jgi:hypothetical protein